MGAFFHGIWVIAVAIESARFNAWRICPGQSPAYDVALGGLLATFCLSAVNQTVMTFISLRGERPFCQGTMWRRCCFHEAEIEKGFVFDKAECLLLLPAAQARLAPCHQAAGQTSDAWVHAGAPLELRKRRWITPALYIQVVLWVLTLGFLGARQAAPMSLVAVPALPGCQLLQPANQGVDNPHTTAWRVGAVLGTVLISRHDLSCWQGAQRTEVFHLLQAMVISTWIFSAMFLCALTAAQHLCMHVIIRPKLHALARLLLTRPLVGQACGVHSVQRLPQPRRVRHLGEAREVHKLAVWLLQVRRAPGGGPVRASPLCRPAQPWLAAAACCAKWLASCRLLCAPLSQRAAACSPQNWCH